MWASRDLPDLALGTSILWLARSRSSIWMRATSERRMPEDHNTLYRTGAS
jgi:hypothetical protein